MIYVPELEQNNCVVVYDSDTIRVYATQPTTNSTIAYKDYYPKMNYLYSNGTETFESVVPTCQEGTTDIMKNININNQIGIVTIVVILGILVIYNFLKDMYEKY